MVNAAYIMRFWSRYGRAMGERQWTCAAASWPLPLTFVQFYMLDVSTLCVARRFCCPDLVRFCLLVGRRLISWSGTTRATISHMETSSEIL